MSSKKTSSRKSGSRFPFFALLGQLRPFLDPFRQRLALAIFLALLLTTVEVATPLLIGLSVDSIFNPGSDRVPAFVPQFGQGAILALLATGVVLRMILVTRQHWLAEWIGERTAFRVREALWNHVQDLPLDYVHSRTPRLLQRFDGDAQAVQRFVTHALVQMPQALLLSGGVLFGIALLNQRIALATGAVVLLVLLLIWRSRTGLREESSAVRRRGKKLASYLQERLRGMALIKSFVRHSLETDNFDELNRDVAKCGARRALLAGRLRGWSSAGVALAGVLALALAIQESAAGRITAGSMVACFLLLGLLRAVFSQIGAAHGYFQEGKVSTERLVGILDLDSEKVSRKKAPPLTVTDGEILVQNVSCRLDKKHVLLADTTLRARRGALTAIVGPEGCGKTTLFELLLSFRQPAGGQILIDGQNIAEVSLKSLRTQVGLVSEDLPLSDGTIRENIGYGLPPKAPQEQVQHAARLAGAEEFIEKLPKKWDTRVVHLSPSQRRQVTLARALAVDPSILLVDEPCLGLNPETEITFAQVLRTLSRDKTVIVAARRLSPSFPVGQNFTLEAIPPRQRRRNNEPHENGEGAGGKSNGDSSDEGE